MDLRPFILAGGSGTRFWPRSRRLHPKQVLALDGERTMLQQTVARLLSAAQPAHCWVITSEALQTMIAGQLPEIPAAQILAEPVARNTAPAAGLAAFLLEREAPDSVLGLFPADHVIEDREGFQAALQAACNLAGSGENIVVLGIHPERAETGYGYIEAGARYESPAKGPEIVHVRRFTEKPNRTRAEEFLASGNYYWNSGMFLGSARTFANAFREHLPETAPLLERIAAAHGTAAFAPALAELYPQCENISIDYAILEPRSAKGERRSNLYCIPAEFGWNDLGSWAALYTHKLVRGENLTAGENVIDAAGASVLSARGNYVHAPGRHVALVSVEDLVVVESGGVLMITTRAGCQDVGRLVKQLEQAKQDELI